MPVWLQPFPLGVPDRLSQREAFPHSLVDTIVQREEKQYIRKRPIQRVRSRWGTAQIHCQVGPASIQQSFNILLCCTRTRTCTRECKHDEKAGLPRHWERERERGRGEERRGSNLERGLFFLLSFPLSGQRYCYGSETAAAAAGN